MRRLCQPQPRRRRHVAMRYLSDAPRYPREREEPRRLDPEQLASHTARLYRAAYGLCASREDAEDLVQETFEQVLKRPRFLRHDQDLAYLLRVLRNSWIRSLRRRRPVAVTPEAQEIESIPDPRGDPVGAVLAWRAIYVALGELPPRLRETVVAVDVLGLSYKEASRALDTKVGTIMSRLNRGRGQIAARLEGDV